MKHQLQHGMYCQNPTKKQLKKILRYCEMLGISSEINIENAPVIQFFFPNEDYTQYIYDCVDPDCTTLITPEEFIIRLQNKFTISKEQQIEELVRKAKELLDKAEELKKGTQPKIISSSLLAGETVFGSAVHISNDFQIELPDGKSSKSRALVYSNNATDINIKKDGNETFVWFTEKQK